MKYKIEHKEELIGEYEVEAEDESLAMDAFEKMVNNGEIDYGKMEVVYTADNLIRKEFQPGQECHFEGAKDQPDRYFIITRLYEIPVMQNDGNTENVRYFDAIKPDGSVMQKFVFNPHRIYRTGRYFPILELMTPWGSKTVI